MTVLNDYHWQCRNYRQRIDRHDWRIILLAEEDTLIFKGEVVKLIADDLGYGVVEVYKQFKVPKTTEEDKT